MSYRLAMKKKKSAAPSSGALPSPSPAPPSPKMPEKEKVEIPDSFLCPITHQIMVSPSIAANGQTYEYDAIHEWFENHNTDPLTGEVLPNKNLIPNRLTKNIIMDYLKSNDHFWDDDHIYFSTKTLKNLLEYTKTGNGRDIERILDEDRRYLRKKLSGDKGLLDVVLEDGALESFKVIFKRVNFTGDFETNKELLKRIFARFDSDGIAFAKGFLSLKDEELKNIFVSSIEKEDIALLQVFILLSPKSIPVQDYQGLLEFSIEKNSTRFFEILVSFSLVNLNETILEKCLELNSTEKFKVLLSLVDQKKLNINKLNRGRTFLSLAIQHANSCFFYDLFKCPTLNVNLIDSDTSSPLMLAVRYRKIDFVLELLKKKEIAVDYQDSNGCTALHHLVVSHLYTTEEILRLAKELLRVGASIKRKTADKMNVVELCYKAERWGLGRELENEYRVTKYKYLTDPLQQEIDSLKAKVKLLEDTISKLSTSVSNNSNNSNSNSNNNASSNSNKKQQDEDEDFTMEFDLFGDSAFDNLPSPAPVVAAVPPTPAPAPAPAAAAAPAPAEESDNDSLSAFDLFG